MSIVLGILVAWYALEISRNKRLQTDFAFNQIPSSVLNPSDPTKICLFPTAPTDDHRQLAGASVGRSWDLYSPVADRVIVRLVNAGVPGSSDSGPVYEPGFERLAVSIYRQSVRTMVAVKFGNGESTGQMKDWVAEFYEENIDKLIVTGLPLSTETVVPRNQWCTFLSVMVPSELKDEWNSLLAANGEVNRDVPILQFQIGWGEITSYDP